MAILAIVLAALGHAGASAGGPCPAHLFVIERSKNANIVAYDANSGAGRRPRGFRARARLLAPERGGG